jgi:hypothetical protein
MTLLRKRSVKKLIRKRIKLNINANMGIIRVAVALVTVLRSVNTTDGSPSVATVGGLRSVCVANAKQDVARIINAILLTLQRNRI